MNRRKITSVIYIIAIIIVVLTGIISLMFIYKYIDDSIKNQVKLINNNINTAISEFNIKLKYETLQNTHNINNLLENINTVWLNDTNVKLKDSVRSIINKYFENKKLDNYVAVHVLNRDSFGYEYNLKKEYNKSDFKYYKDSTFDSLKRINISVPIILNDSFAGVMFYEIIEQVVFKKILFPDRCDIFVSRKDNPEKYILINLSYYNGDKKHRFFAEYNYNVPVKIGNLEYILTIKHYYDKTPLLLCIVFVLIFLFVIILLLINLIKLGRATQDIQKLKKDNDELLAKVSLDEKILLEKEEIIQKYKHENINLSCLVNASLEGIIIHDRGFPILFNKAVLDMMGYDEAEMKELKINRIIFPKYSNYNEINIKTNNSYETLALKKDRKTFPVEIVERCIEYNGKLVMITIIRDISKKKSIENELREERRNRVTSIIDSLEAERHRFARELHDGVGQSLIAAKLKLEAMEEKGNVVEGSEEIKQILNNIIDEIRQISYDIMPSVLGEFGIISAITALCNKINETKRIKINFVYDDIPTLKDQKVNIYLYRIVQESVNNIIKHSKATTANIKISYFNKMLEVEISDNGKGFDVNNLSNNKGNGINNIKERVLLLNGKIDIFSNDNGTIIKIKIPITII